MKRPISYFRLYQHLRFTEQQGNGEAISLNPPYQFQLLHRHIEITLEITVGSSALHIVNSRTRTGNPDITYTFSNFLILFVFVFLFLFVILILPLFVWIKKAYGGDYYYYYYYYHYLLLSLFIIIYYYHLSS